MITHSNKLEIRDSETHNLPVRTAYSYSRLSTLEQLKGTGLKRQVESAIAFCKENNLRLDETLKLSDMGVSAFKGANIVRGKLGKFLELVDAGKVRRGSVLLVENLDRVSRQNVVDAQELFLSIINRGITIVTMMDKQWYSREEIKKNPAMLLMSIMCMIRANEESETKSKRIIRARQVRRNLASDGKEFQIYCPPWCNWTDGKFKVDAHKANVIKRIFKMYLDGKGALAIASTLNLEGVPNFGRGTAHKYKDSEAQWYKKAIANLLKDRRLIGHAHWIDKDNYFPAAVSADLFNQVQARLAERKRKGGQIGSGPISIFAGVLHCGRCGGSVGKVRCINSEGYEYFYYVCENARTGKDCCKYRSILFDTIEDSFLFLMRFRPWFHEMMKDDGTGNQVEQRIEILKGELLEAERQILKIRNLILTEDNPPKTIVSTLAGLEQKAENTKARLSIEEGRRVEQIAPQHSEEFFETLPEKMKDADFRLKVREVVRSMVVDIKLFVHDTKHPYYQIERTNGNFWSVVFLNATRKRRQFQIFKGKAEIPDERAFLYCGDGRG